MLRRPKEVNNRIKIYNWEAQMDEEKPGEIEVRFHLEGINKPEAFIMAFEAGKSIVDATNPNVFGWVMNLAMFLYGLFKKSK